MAYSPDVLENPPFQLHIEPDRPIELNDMLRSLAAIGHRFEIFAAAEGLSTAKNAKLLVTSVKPGSIDIGLLPDYATLGSLLAPALVYSAPVLKFATALKGLVDKFKKNDPGEATIRDANDVIAITRPIADNGGTQTFNVSTGDTYNQVFLISGADAKTTMQNAIEHKARLQAFDSETYQNVPLVWHGLDKGAARTDGRTTPDKAVIEELDQKPRPVFFDDDFAATKRLMIDDQENPYQKVFFVDVSVSRVKGRVVSYRVIGYHGDTDLDLD